MLHRDASRSVLRGGRFPRRPVGAGPARADHARARRSCARRQRRVPLRRSLCAAAGAGASAPSAAVESSPLRPAHHARRSARVSFHPAGHVLGLGANQRSKAPAASGSSPATTSARPIPPAPPFEPVPCDTFITESTFGLPIYRWDPTGQVIVRARWTWWRGNRDRGPDLDRLLLHHRQGAAAARRAGARHRPAGAACTA